MIIAPFIAGLVVGFAAYWAGVWHTRRQIKKFQYRVLPQRPPPGLLMSMAMRHDHAIGAPGYYDQPIFSRQRGGVSHKDRLNLCIQEMGKLYEEVAGYGFYRPQREQEYLRKLEECRRSDT